MTGLVYRVLCRGQDWWARTWPTLCMGLFYAGVVLVGCIGFRDPSISMTRLVGAAYLIYATGALTLGVLGIVAAVQGARRAESVCIITISLLTVLHGTIVILGSEGNNGLQTGVRLLIGLPAAIVLAHYRANTVYTRRDIREALFVAERAAAVDLAREEAASRDG